VRRRHRIAAVFTYAGGSQHDRYFFSDPPEMIAGAVRIPAFSMRNEPLIRKHVHSATLTILRELAQGAEVGLLENTFPQYIRSYLSESSHNGDRSRLRYFTEPPQFPEFANLIRTYRARILQRLVDLFNRDWPADEQQAVAPDVLARYLDEMTPRLERHVRLLFNQVKAYRQMLALLRDLDEHDLRSSETDERMLRQRLERARDSYMQTNIENYTLSWLSVDGFFPGYALEGKCSRNLYPAAHAVIASCTHCPARVDSGQLGLCGRPGVRRGAAELQQAQGGE
jgi:hypothetical protein